MKKISAKYPEDSATRMVEVVLPNDTNLLGNVLGGRVMHWIDIAGAVAARRHSRRPVVTASMDVLTFKHPIKLGEVAILEASLIYVGKTSMDVEVHVYSEEISGKKKQTSTAYLTFVALDDNGKPTSVPKLKLKTEEQKKKFKQAERMREIRKRLKTEI
ncbi:MAG: acyl-CoA thioesterase [Candidatus Schekmanbacteria bacterium RIFCSPHIGHO2_02_FULL_38_11]|uniref:Acyl-CoA thioesterase n=1 Tax=Candidatus Schekmanbacteria bacterium RIFCSPLOWO2_12_FULL_38_15 TaxID=1817883 RepID=A0A1F7SG02_9BACT|nr:MAG: acyl-CoA thioesterase [Candidatus Schekmanbacteria bacterium GWA2_38_9]OGL48968.1 MAG: acyl-CoA thioesterase [Candidatus Schekmanbacteria bacterium RIFCSPHIGHO2_02_FULL_38_11]OGL49121.1 MAG: acyl-CoA thioesterase [Candidatus Schekmanbacteria bacterium RIFCSPLOWO2_02_FULL_38_14]OGL52097.1 MAG: acyl-CoA thioesterase [Candidatus Schekmanbacteria bacterium RIFCSPLOWO2_12_FULL_38_15]